MSKKRKTMVLQLIMAFLLVVASGCTNQRCASMVNAGDSQMLACNYQSAAQYYQKAEKIKASEKVSLRLATALVKKGDYTVALMELDKVSQGSPKADYLRAVCSLGLNDVTAAERCIERSLQGNPDDSFALAILGQVKFLQKEYAQSIEAYQNALAASSDEAVRTKLYYNLAMSQLSAGQAAQADASFNRYLVKQNFVTAEDNRTAGAIAYAAGDHERALRHWQKLSGKEKQEILNAIADESITYSVLAIAN